jgi:hypothetical protein
VLHAVYPVSFVDLTFRPRVNAEAMFHVVAVFAFVAPLVGPGIPTDTMKEAVKALSGINATVSPLMLPDPVHDVRNPFSIVRRAVFPFKHAQSFFKSLLELSFVFRVISPLFMAKPILLPIFPLASVSSS